MDEQEMRNHLEEGWDHVYIIVELGNPEDNCYEPQRMHVQSVDWDNGVVKLSYFGSNEIVDVSPFDEVFAWEPDAQKFIDTYM